MTGNHVTAVRKVLMKALVCFQPESDGSRSGSSLSLRNIPPGGASGGNAQSPSHGHRGVHRSISATNPKPSRRASSGGETLRESQQGATSGGGLIRFAVLRARIPLEDIFLVPLYLPLRVLFLIFGCYRNFGAEFVCSKQQYSFRFQISSLLNLPPPLCTC